MKRIICILLAAMAVFICSVSAAAVDYGCDVSTVSKAVYLENLDTGAVVFTKNAEERMYPASTTKIMTYAIVAENISDFDNTTVDIREDVIADLDPESTVMGLEDHIGEQYSIRDLLYGMMLPSGNDAALVLADYVGGSISGFADMMNSRAAELGCENTHFVNPHGLYDPNHYTTAKDLATITKYARTLQSFTEITNTLSYTPKGFEEPLKNTNLMLSAEHGGQYYYPYAKGIKTGYTDEAGRCLVSTAEKDEYTYLCVVLGAEYSYEEDVNYAMLDTASLYDWTFTNIGYQTVYDSSHVAKTVDIRFGKDEDRLNLVPEDELTAFLPNDYDEALVKVDVACEDSFDAPITQGQVLGTATVHYDDILIGTTNIIASNSVELDEVQFFFYNLKEWIKSHMVIVAAAAIGFLAILIILIAVIIVIRKRRARTKPRYRFK